MQRAQPQILEAVIVTFHGHTLASDRLTRKGIMKRKQHLQSFLSVCNKRLLSATARHAGKRPSVSFLADYLFKEETSTFYSRACFVIFKLNLLPKLKKLKDLKIGQDTTK